MTENPTPAEIAAYIDQFASSIVVRVRTQLACEWQDFTIARLRTECPEEAERVTRRLMEMSCFPPRVLVV